MKRGVHCLVLSRFRPNMAEFGLQDIAERVPRRARLKLKACLLLVSTMIHQTTPCKGIAWGHSARFTDRQLGQQACNHSFQFLTLRRNVGEVYNCGMEAYEMLFGVERLCIPTPTDVKQLFPQMANLHLRMLFKLRWNCVLI